MMRRLTPSRHLCQGVQPPWRLIRTHLEQKPRLVLRTPLLTVLALGLAFRVLPLTQPNYLTGVLEYDDGVHYAAALALLHQQFPYANFAFLHPPGIIVLLAPFAALGQILSQPVAMAAARLTMVAIGLASITLVWRLARGSDLVRAVAAGAYAVAPAVLVAEHTVLLEPLLNLGTLLALRMLLRSNFPVERGVRNAGLVLGLTMSIKIFAAVVPVAIALWLLSRRQYRLALLHVFAAGATFVLVLLPFVLRAPSAAVRDIALLQLRRPPAGIPTGDARLSDLLQLSPAFGHPVSTVGLLLAALAIAATLASVQHPRARLLSLMFLLTSASFFLAPSYYTHYAAFLLPPMALLIAEAATSSAACLSRIRRGAGRVTVTALVLVLAVGGIRTSMATPAQDDIRANVRSLGHAPKCLFTDSASLAISADLLRPANSRCATWVDGRGYALTLLGPNAPADFYEGGFSLSNSGNSRRGGSLNGRTPFWYEAPQ